jgi:hypothetical protein
MHADWKRTSFAKFWSLPQGNRFVSEWTWTDRDIAYLNKEAVRLEPDFSQVLRRQGEIFDRKADELKECARQVRKKADDIERRKGR